MNSKITVTNTTMPHRLGHGGVCVTSSDGRPLPGVEVEVAQVSHDFWFGNLLFDFIDYANGTSDDPDRDSAEFEKWMALYNFGTLPFYWRTFEPSPGDPVTPAMLSAARHFVDFGILLKGHPLAWHTLCPRWLLGRSLEEVEVTLRERIIREAGQFAGVVDMLDAINELVIMPVFTAEDNAITPLCRHLGRMAMGRLVFATARAANPAATLLINDFDLSTAYECLIEGLLEAGVGIDAIGLQTHMHQGYRGAEEIASIIDRFARFGLPLHFTEASLVSGHLMPPEIVDLNDYQVEHWPSTPEGEARQAAEMVDFYQTVMTHPSVVAITYWGLSDRGAWLGAPIGLLRADGTPKPSYDALHGLIKGDWWVPPTKAVTDENGQVEITGFKGTYEASLAGEEPTEFHLGEEPTGCRLLAT